MNNNLLFIYNELLDSDVSNDLKLPLEFICFATIDGKMYRHFRNDSVFILPLGDTKLWGNSKIYGALFLCKDIEFYISLLDAYHVCSKDKLRRNHIKDIHHREVVTATPIFFNDLDELSRLKYREGNVINATTYFGNINHPKIIQRFGTTKSYRIVDGINTTDFKKLYRSV